MLGEVGCQDKLKIRCVFLLREHDFVLKSQSRGGIMADEGQVAGKWAFSTQMNLSLLGKSLVFR